MENEGVRRTMQPWEKAERTKRHLSNDTFHQPVLLVQANMR